MTPEQLQQYVDAALKQRDQFDLVFYPLTIVLSVGGAWLFSYLREKGKNLATKEDISEITIKVESIKTNLAAKQHFSHLRYEREMKLYDEIWKLVHDFYTESVSAFGWRMARNLPSHYAIKQTEESWTQAWEQLVESISKNKPFYPNEIWKELSAFEDLCWELVLEYQSRVESTGQIKERRELSNRLKTQYEQVEQAIRNRLTRFDNIN